MIRVIRTDSSNEDFKQLVALLDKGLEVTDGNDFPFFAQFNTLDNIKHAVVAYSGETAVGCGAIKEYAPGIAEIKRMFVKEEFRKQGVASAILSGLESWACELQFESCILETGNMLLPAISLYEKSGYRHIPNYGQYIGVETSVCMKKDLKPV